MSAKATASASGIGFTGMLTVAFVVLKLMGVIDWSWWWVLSPIWIVTLIWLIIIALIIAAVK